MENTGKDPIKQLFNQLDQWRHLPAYQLERRADIFFSLYLPEVLQKKFELQEPPVLIPEFPCRIGTVYANNAESKPKKAKSNQSFKIDYLALGVNKKSEKVAYLVELKTDNASINENQNDNMEAAANVDVKCLIGAIPSIQRASKEKGKYNCLIKLTEQFQGWDVQPKLVFITPTAFSETCSKKHIPFVAENGEFSFHQFLTEHANKSDPIAKRFAESLKKWATTKAGTIPVVS